jgi:pimeloyl-ACP methyl ester carboxylesterase
VPFIQLHDGTSVRYREAGGGPGTPVLLVHGAGSSSAIWVGTMHRLVRAGGIPRRVVAIDLPGHGRSGGAPRSFDELLQAIGMSAAVLCLGRSILVGHSMGGLLTVAAGLSWPDKVAGLGLITTAARFQVSSRLLRKIDEDWTHWPDFLRELAYSAETHVDVRRRSASIASDGATQAQTRADFDICQQHDARPRLGELLSPALVVTGAHDQMAAPKYGAELAEGIPGARHVVLEACGHFPMHEQPDRLGQALTAFVGACG